MVEAQAISTRASVGGCRQRHHPAIKAAPMTTPGCRPATTTRAARKRTMSWLCQLRDDSRIDIATSSPQRQVGAVGTARPRINLDEVGELKVSGQRGQPISHRRAAPVPPDGVDACGGGIRAQQLLVYLGALIGQIQLDGDALVADDQQAIGSPHPTGTWLHAVGSMRANGVASQLSLGNPPPADMSRQQLLAEVDDG